MCLGQFASSGSCHMHAIWQSGSLASLHIFTTCTLPTHPRRPHLDNHLEHPECAHSTSYCLVTALVLTPLNPKKRGWLDAQWMRTALQGASVAHCMLVAGTTQRKLSQHASTTFSVGPTPSAAAGLDVCQSTCILNLVNLGAQACACNTQFPGRAATAAGGCCCRWLLLQAVAAAGEQYYCHSGMTTGTGLCGRAVPIPQGRQADKRLKKRLKTRLKKYLNKRLRQRLQKGPLCAGSRAGRSGQCGWLPHRGPLLLVHPARLP